MKKTVLILSYFILMLLQTSCNKILLYSYGIRNPKIENQKSIFKYLKNNKLSTDNNFCLKDTTTFNKFILQGISAPEIRFYDHNGYLMIYRDDKRCNGQNDSLITFLDPKNVVKIDSSENIHSYLAQLKMLDGKDINPEDFKNYDYYLITYWAKWIGKVNKTKMDHWNSSIKQKKNLKIKDIKVTADYMDFWVLDKKDMIKIYSRKSKTENK
jgi:hypothetical protein